MHNKDSSDNHSNYIMIRWFVIAFPPNREMNHSRPHSAHGQIYPFHLTGNGRTGWNIFDKGIVMTSDYTKPKQPVPVTSHSAQTGTTEVCSRKPPLDEVHNSISKYGASSPFFCSRCCCLWKPARFWRIVGELRSIKAILYKEEARSRTGRKIVPVCLLQEIFTQYLLPHPLTPGIVSTWPLIKSGSHGDTSCCNSLPIVNQWLPNIWPWCHVLIIAIIFWRLVCCSNCNSKQENQCLQNRNSGVFSNFISNTLWLVEDLSWNNKNRRKRKNEEPILKHLQ